MTAIYNLEKLITVKITNKELSDMLIYQEPKKRWFLPDLKEGFVNKYLGFYTKEEVLSGKASASGTPYLVEDNKAYFPACVKLTFSDKISHTTYYSDYQHALDYGRAIAAKGMKAKLEVEI